MSKHTQGGWFIVDHAWNAASVYTKNKTVCSLSVSEDDATEENQDSLTAEMLANAHLIAAAPMMLEALKRALKDMDRIDEVCRLAGVHSFSLMRKDLEAAISATKGEAE